ncbi:hypothetical protein DL96DRAFT_367855 [Flagelloscypha sp. PMI_526]|nr:hypothetical protein DL96DRAFT_367855 [Flagelloscypha sp. PMI_526]
MSQGYDRSLVQAAPVVTNPQIEAGYDAKLLESNQIPRPPANSYDVQDKRPVLRDTRPFWRTRKGIMIIAAIIIITLAAAFGGTVGGILRKQRNGGAKALSEDSQSTSSTTASTSSVLAHQTIEVLTTSLLDNDGLTLAVLTLSATIEMFQTDHPINSLHVPHPVTTTFVIEPEGITTKAITTTITAFFPPVTEGAGSPTGFSSVLSRGAGSETALSSPFASPTSRLRVFTRFLARYLHFHKHYIRKIYLF